MTSSQEADVCLILEGTYPYVRGGVANWTHDLIRAQEDLSFHIVALVPPDFDGEVKFDVPPNVRSLTTIETQALPHGDVDLDCLDKVMADLHDPLLSLSTNGSMRDVEAVLEALRPVRDSAGRAALLNSRQAWDLLSRMYEQQCPQVSFLEYFWTWRTLCLGLYSVLSAPLVPAHVYHALCTGYAGLYATRARIETGRPALLTEHGIYTSERRVELTMATWLQREAGRSLSIDRLSRDLRDLWMDTFTSYSRACYAACSKVITLYEGNAVLQAQEGADPARLLVIHNGIELAETKPHSRNPAVPTVAFIGRVVPIKDIKTFLRACAILLNHIPGVRVWILGPLDEDPDYADECRQLAAHLGLDRSLEFKGNVDLKDYFPSIDVIVLTSISEAQPLVILEAAAVGIPAVATDVGACREMILGRSDEDPPLGAAGAVTSLANPAATAQALRWLLTDVDGYERCAQVAQERVRRYYDKAELDRAYRDIYQQLIETPSVAGRA